MHTKTTFYVALLLKLLKLFVKNENLLLETVYVFRVSFQHRDKGTFWGQNVICSAVLFALHFFPNLHSFAQVLTQPRSQSERHLAGKYRTWIIVNRSVEKAKQNPFQLCTESSPLHL
jgi:hypothetical protein